jgi:hypothetical protein
LAEVDTIDEEQDLRTKINTNDRGNAIQRSCESEMKVTSGRMCRPEVGDRRVDIINEWSGKPTSYHEGDQIA